MHVRSEIVVSIGILKAAMVPHRVYKMLENTCKHHKRKVSLTVRVVKPCFRSTHNGFCKRVPDSLCAAGMFVKSWPVFSCTDFFSITSLRLREPGECCFYHSARARLLALAMLKTFVCLAGVQYVS